MLYRAYPNQWCASEFVREVNVSGRSLMDGLNPYRAHCNYTFKSGEEYSKQYFKLATLNVTLLQPA